MSGRTFHDPVKGGRGRPLRRPALPEQSASGGAATSFPPVIASQWAHWRGNLSSPPPSLRAGGHTGAAISSPRRHCEPVGTPARQSLLPAVIASQWAHRRGNLFPPAVIASRWAHRRGNLFPPPSLRAGGRTGAAISFPPPCGDSLRRYLIKQRSQRREQKQAAVFSICQLKMKLFEIATALKGLAMTGGIGFSRCRKPSVPGARAAHPPEGG